MTLKRISLKVSEDLYNWIREESENEGMTMNSLIVVALKEYRKSNTVVDGMGDLKALFDMMKEQEKKSASD